MSQIERIVNSPRYADLVVHRGVARWVEVAADTSGDATEQIRQILEQIDAMLSHLRCTRRSLLEVVIYLSDLREVTALNVLWDAWIDPDYPPSRACVGVQLQGELQAEFVIRAAVD